MITLISDLDGTLIGDDDSLKELNDFIESDRENYFLIYATGRNYAEYESAMQYENLITADALILNTGADIYFNEGGTFIHSEEWHDNIKKNWQPEMIHNIVSANRWVTSQGKNEELKLSYFVGKGEAKSTCDEIIGELTKYNLRAKIILSHDVYLDVLPEGCDKAKAAEFIISKAGIKDNTVIVAGDSENDIELFESYDNCIVVANAYEGLFKAVKGLSLYLAEGSCAAGVLEGLKYYMSK